VCAGNFQVSFLKIALDTLSEFCNYRKGEEGEAAGEDRGSLTEKVREDR